MNKDFLLELFGLIGKVAVVTGGGEQFVVLFLEQSQMRGGRLLCLIFQKLQLIRLPRKSIKLGDSRCISS